MGNQLSTYSSKEIHELISSEKIMPSLFWVMPIGQDWKWDELNTIHDIFNDINNSYPYRLLGNYFVKNEDPIADKKFNKKSKLVAASDANEISKLLNGYINKRGKSILILSSFFPQPGWGIIIDVKDITEILNRLNKVLLNGKFEKLIEASKVIYPSYLEYNKLLNSIPLEPTREIIETYELCYNYINQLIEDNLNFKILDDILKIAYKIDYDFSNKYEYYKSFCIIYNNKNKAENVISNYRECIESGRFNDCNDRVEKNLIQVFNSFRGIPKAQINQILSDFEKWLSDSYEDYTNDLQSRRLQFVIKISELNLNYKKALGEFKGLKQKWQNHYLTQNPTHRKIVNDFIISVMDHSPIFLIELEKEFKNESKICVWDDARMIGWKITGSLKNTPYLRSFAMYLNKNFKTNIEIVDIDSNEVLNGDTFTDYLHYLFLKDNSKYGDKRKLAEKMLDFFRSNEIEDICEELGLQNDLDKDISEFIKALGWLKPSHVEYDTSLISFFEKNKDDQYNLSNPKIETWNSLRISLESYCKDLIKIITSNLPNDKNQFFDLVQIKSNDFSFQYRNNWDKEIEEIKLGPANRIICALGTLWQIDVDWHDFYNTIKKISEITNKPSHHNKIIRTEDVISSELNPLFNKFFVLANHIFKIMPWHFKPISNFWTNPAVYSGMAWSHDHYEKKEIRILVWESETKVELNKEILVWNPSKINPVMTKYTILS